MDSPSYAGRDSDKGIDFPTFRSNGLDEWVIFVDFLQNYGKRKYVLTICRFDEL